MPPVMFSVVTKYHKGRHSLFLYNSEIFYAFTQDILRSPKFTLCSNSAYLLLFFSTVLIVVVATLSALIRLTCFSIS
ncbi:hypothetical protein CJP43_06120 [Lactiplantibacillus plantarum]|nr:hypothetical protein CJP43_06120 [Lactiplantibacillus plantarum]